MYSEDDANNSEDGNYINFDNCDLDPDKSLDYEDVIFWRNEKMSCSCDYEMWKKKKKTKKKKDE